MDWRKYMHDPLYHINQLQVNHPVQKIGVVHNVIAIIKASVTWWMSRWRSFSVYCKPPVLRLERTKQAWLRLIWALANMSNESNTSDVTLCKLGSHGLEPCPNFNNYFMFFFFFRWRIRSKNSFCDAGRTWNRVRDHRSSLLWDVGEFALSACFKCRAARPNRKMSWWIHLRVHERRTSCYPGKGPIYVCYEKQKENK